MNKYFVYDAGDFLKGFSTKEDAEQHVKELEILDDEGFSCLYIVDIEEHRDIQDGEDEYDAKYEL